MEIVFVFLQSKAQKRKFEALPFKKKLIAYNENNIAIMTHNTSEVDAIKIIAENEGLTCFTEKEYKTLVEDIKNIEADITAHEANVKTHEKN